jgi:hypothetical protein
LQTPHGISVQRIEYEEEWFKIRLQQSEKNYFSIFLPEVFEGRMPKRLAVVEI